jgi:hypothetical protein
MISQIPPNIRLRVKNVQWNIVFGGAAAAGRSPESVSTNSPYRPQVEDAIASSPAPLTLRASVAPKNCINQSESRLIEENSSATAPISLTPKAVCTVTSSRSLATSHI